MGSCVSKKASAGAKVAAPLPPEKDNAVPLPPAAVVVVEEEVKEVLSETAVQRPRPPEPEQEKVKRIQEDEASDSGVSVGSSCVCVVEKAMVKIGSSEQEVEKRTVDDAPDKLKEKAKMRKASPDLQRNPIVDVGNGSRTRSPSPAAPKQRRRQEVVSGIGCRSGRFSPSAARRAAESAAVVRRTYSAREADMVGLPLSSTAKRSLNASIRRDPGERSGRRPDSPARRTPATSPAAKGTISRQSSAARKVPKENVTCSPDQTKRRCGPGEYGEIGLDEAPLADGKQLKEVAEGQNPSVAMECFIFL